MPQRREKVSSYSWRVSRGPCGWGAYTSGTFGSAQGRLSLECQSILQQTSAERSVPPWVGSGGVTSDLLPRVGRRRTASSRPTPFSECGSRRDDINKQPSPLEP